MSRPLLAYLLPLFLSFSCASSETDSDIDQQTSSIAEGSREAVGLLEFLNQTNFEELDVEVALDSRAAANLMSFRAGADGTQGTADDQQFETVSQVDAVPRIGPAAMERLLAYVVASGWVPGDNDPMGTFDGVTFTYGQADAALSLVNTASEQTLREQVSLASQAVNSILEARPIADMQTLADLYYLGTGMLTRIREYVDQLSSPEIGIISDLDKTVVPPSTEGLDGLPPASYPGVPALYSALEFGNDGTAGDVHYVTARPSDRVAEIPGWLLAHGIPTGTIDTGISGVPWVARGEKVADITRLMAEYPGQMFVMIGDTSHVDPDAFRDIRAAFPDRVAAAFVHKVKNISAERSEGLVVFDNYAQVAGELFNVGIFDEATARMVMEAAADEGLALTGPEIDQLIESYRP